MTPLLLLLMCLSSARAHLTKLPPYSDYKGWPSYYEALVLRRQLATNEIGLWIDGDDVLDAAGADDVGADPSGGQGEHLAQFKVGRRN